MQEKKSIWTELKKYPIMLLFFTLLGVVTLVDLVKPYNPHSDFENRDLPKAPAFNLSAIVNNEWTVQYGEYIKDQFLFRDAWVSGQSLLESAQGKLENGGVWYAKDGYQIAKNSNWSSLQQQRLPQNTNAVCQLAQRHPGQVDVMVVPSPANTLHNKLRWNPPQIDENEMLDGIFADVELAGGNAIDLRQSFAAHEDEQLYYRTDHHWTTTGGAWLAYAQFCEENGLPVLAPKATLVELDRFYGTNYAKTKKAGTKPDTLAYYDYANILTVYEQGSDGLPVNGTDGPVMNPDNLPLRDNYVAFLRGNNGYSEIAGNGTGSILLIKDSYGNCFAPYLIENYAKIGIVDLRGWTGSVDLLYEAGGFERILVLYSFDTFTQDQYIYRMGD